MAARNVAGFIASRIIGGILGSISQLFAVALLASAGILGAIAYLYSLVYNSIVSYVNQVTCTISCQGQNVANSVGSSLQIPLSTVLYFDATALAIFGGVFLILGLLLSLGLAVLLNSIIFLLTLGSFVVFLIFFVHVPQILWNFLGSIGL